MLFHEGRYLYCESRHQRGIVLRQARTIHGIAADPGVCIWTAPATGPCSHAVWAPELHLINGKWYIYFAADNGRNENHRMWVLESEGSDPLGPYRCHGPLRTSGWAIDGTILTNEDGSLYFIWSGWPGRTNGQQNLYIAPMKNPLELAGPRVLIAVPDQPWERVAMPICEGPQILSRDGSVFIIYSASGSWTPDYCLGMLANHDGDFLNPKSWSKRGPVFQNTEHVWGIGHCSFVKSPCSTEDWIVYHSKSRKDHGWEDRDVHAKRFHWTMDGYPDFGEPVPRGVPHQPLPMLNQPMTAIPSFVDGMPMPASIREAITNNA
jgi:GH43 family beta-xylosidase